MSHPEAAPQPSVEPSFERKMADLDARMARAAEDETSTGRHATGDRSKIEEIMNSRSTTGDDYVGKRRRGSHRANDTATAAAAGAAGAAVGAAAEAAQATDPVDDMPRSVDEWRRKFGVAPTPAGQDPLDDLFNNNTANTAGAATMTDQEFQDFLNGSPAAPAGATTRSRRERMQDAYLGLRVRTRNWLDDVDNDGERRFSRRTKVALLGAAAVLGTAAAIKGISVLNHHDAVQGAGQPLIAPKGNAGGVTHPYPVSGSNSANFAGLVNVHKGEGFDELVGDVTDKFGVHLTGGQEHKIAHDVLSNRNGEVFLDNNSYHMGDSYGIGRPGESHLAPGVEREILEAAAKEAANK